MKKRKKPSAILIEDLCIAWHWNEEKLRTNLAGWTQPMTIHQLPQGDALTIGDVQDIYSAHKHPIPWSKLPHQTLPKDAMSIAKRLPRHEI